MRNYPLVSVVIPLYNYEKYIVSCLDSCCAQKYPNMEIIVVDDVSKDSSYRVAKSYRDQRVACYRMDKNGGYSKAKNFGIIQSRGDYIVTLDADDMLTPDSIMERYKAIKEHGVPMVHGYAYLVKGSYNYHWCVKNAKALDIRIGKLVHAQTTMIHRSVHRKYGLYDETLRSRSDNEMWHRLFDVAKLKHYCINKPLAFYRRHDKSMVSYRKKNTDYNNQITKLLLAAKAMRMKDGITRKNTKFLK